MLLFAASFYAATFLHEDEGGNADMAKLIPGVNDLATVNPELAKEWHPTKNGNLFFP